MSVFCQQTMKKSSGIFFFLLSASLFSVLTAESDDGSPAVHIVHVKQSDGEPEAYHIRILDSVLGSEEAAKAALVYHYKHAASGFSAKLTPKQASQLSKHPDVLLVSPSGRIHLHSGLGSIHGTHIHSGLGSIRGAAILP